jgi:hypothetical protein
MTSDPIAAQAGRTFGVAARHYKRTDGLGQFAGPLCGQRAMNGGGWARTNYTTDALRVTCKKCEKALKAQGGAAS